MNYANNAALPQVKQAAKEYWETRAKLRQCYFWSKVEVYEPFQCWPWKSTRNKKGYGNFSIGNKQRLAHRVSYELAIGKIPDGLQVCHHCDNPSCVNPTHLFVGTGKDNQQDCVQKGRKPDIKGIKNPMFGIQGEKHPSSVISDAKVIEIRTRYYSGNIKQSELAKEFGVTQALISAICRGATWKHLPILPPPLRYGLTEIQIQEIRTTFVPKKRKGEGSGGFLAKKFNIPRYAITNIIRFHC